VLQFFANDYIIFAFLNSLEYVKYKRKRLFNDETTLTSTLVKSTNTAQNIYL